jgi:cation:H+ antiporter
MALTGRSVGMTLGTWLVVFGLSAGVLVVVGTHLSRAGDQIATLTGVGGMLVGGILLAGATSLPELATDVSAAIEGAPSLAVGDLFGSSMANMAILAVIDLVGRRHVLPAVELTHAQVGSIAIALTALAVLGVATPVGLAIGWVGLDTVLVTAAYVTAVVWVRRSRAQRGAGGTGAEVGRQTMRATGWGLRGDDGAGLRASLLRFGLAAAVVLVAAPIVAISAEGIATEAAIGETAVGTSLVAVATSLPELVASLAAVRIGAHDLAVGNLFGSNALNMGMLLAIDLAYVDGPLLTAVSSPPVIVAGVGAILLMAVAIAIVVGGTETRIRRLEPDAVILLAAYVGALAAVWFTSV